MGYRCGWQQIGRNDFEEIPPMSAADKSAISKLTVALAEGMKTIYDVFRNGTFIGQVSTTFGGQFFRKTREEDFMYAAWKWNTDDPEHGIALIELLNS